MRLQNFKTFHDPNLLESQLDNLAGDLSDLGFGEKKWTWSEIQSAWHKIEWDEIISFTLLNPPERVKFEIIHENGEFWNPNSILSVKTLKVYRIWFDYDVLAGAMKKILNETKTGVSGQRYTLPQILNTIELDRKTDPLYSIPDIFDKCLCRKKVDEDNYNLWLDFGVVCVPKPNGKKEEFEVKLVDMVLKVNWDEVADLMCNPIILKELKRKLDEIAGF